MANKSTCPSCRGSIYLDACPTVAISVVYAEDGAPDAGAYDVCVWQCPYCHIWVESHRECK